MSDYGVVLFHTTAAAMRAESVLVKAGLQVRLIPTPRHLSSDCGIALRFAWEQEELVCAELAASRVEMAAVHRLPA